MSAKKGQSSKKTINLSPIKEANSGIKTKKDGLSTPKMKKAVA